MPDPETAARVPPGRADAFSLLIVCTANICRSPALELLIRSRPDALLHVASAGTEASPGHSVATPMAALLARRDAIDARAFRSRRLERPMIESADLVLTAARSHRAVVSQLCPEAFRRTFTVREFLRIAPVASGVTSESGAQGPAELVAAASRLREPAQRPEDDDIPDPYGRSRRVYARSLDDLRRDAGRLLDLLRSR